MDVLCEVKAQGGVSYRNNEQKMAFPEDKSFVQNCGNVKQHNEVQGMFQCIEYMCRNCCK